VGNIYLSSDFEDSDQEIGVTGVEGVSISRPGEGNRDGLFLGLHLEVVDGRRLERGDEGFVLKIPDGYSLLSGSAQPISSRRED